MATTQRDAQSNPKGHTNAKALFDVAWQRASGSGERGRLVRGNSLCEICQGCVWFDEKERLCLGASSAIVETPKVTDSLSAIKDSTPILHPRTSSFDSFTSLTSICTIRLEVQLGNYVPSDDYTLVLEPEVKQIQTLRRVWHCLMGYLRPTYDNQTSAPPVLSSSKPKAARRTQGERSAREIRSGALGGNLMDVNADTDYLERIPRFHLQARLSNSSISRVVS